MHVQIERVKSDKKAKRDTRSKKRRGGMKGGSEEDGEKERERERLTHTSDSLRS